MPLLKLAEFGDQASSKGSLRTDDNLLRCFGVEGDYDAGKVSIDEAAERLRAEKLEAFLYSTPSSTPDKPRWRVLCPLSEPCSPAERREMVGLLNAALGGILATESFAASQIYYYGQVSGNPYEYKHVKGVALDVLRVICDPVYPGVKEQIDQAGELVDYSPLTLAEGREPDAELIAALLSGESYHPSLCAMAARYIGRGMQEGAVVETLRGLMLGTGDTSDRAKERIKQIPALVRSAIEKFAPTTPAAEFTFVDFASLAHTPPPEREWLVAGWIPKGHVTSLYGKGASGKSLLAMQLGIAVATGTSWLGMDVQQGPVLGMFCEDDDGEMKRRAANIFAAQLLPADEVSGLHLSARIGLDNVLMDYRRDGHSWPSALLDQLREQCQLIRPTLVILDNIAQIFAGCENDRSQVTPFVNALSGLANDFQCSVLLLGHPAKADGSAFSGSTAWENAVRSRLLLESAEGGNRTLRIDKANYGPKEDITLEYINHTLAPISLGSPEQQAADAKGAILSSLEYFTQHGINTSAKPRAYNYLVREMHKANLMPVLVNPTFVKEALAKMITAGELIAYAELWQNKNRSWKMGIATAKVVAQITPEDIAQRLHTGVQIEH